MRQYLKIDNESKMEFNQKYIGKSITGVYADFWDIKNFSCNEKKRKPNVCISY